MSQMEVMNAFKWTAVIKLLLETSIIEHRLNLDQGVPFQVRSETFDYGTFHVRYRGSS